MQQNTVTKIKMDKGYKSLIVYQLSFKLAGEIFRLSKKFPPEEKYELTCQVRRSSRSVCANISEGYRKRTYVKHFTSKMTDADGEASETNMWLDFALDCEYITPVEYQTLSNQYEEIGKMLGSMIRQPEKFLPRNK